jgi:hypothetical protein
MASTRERWVASEAIASSQGQKNRHREERSAVAIRRDAERLLVIDGSWRLARRDDHMKLG